MTFKLEINCDNAAFDDCGTELSRILSDVAHIVNREALQGLKGHAWAIFNSKESVQNDEVLIS